MTAYASRTHTYKGETIEPCESAENHGQHFGRWFIRLWYAPNAYFADEECQHFNTLADAREYIDDR